MSSINNLFSNMAGLFNTTRITDSLSNGFETIKNSFDHTYNAASAALSLTNGMTTCINTASYIYNYTMNNLGTVGLVGGSALSMLGGVYTAYKMANMKSEEDESEYRFSGTQIAATVASSALPLYMTGASINPLLSTTAAVVATAGLIAVGSDIRKKIGQSEMEVCDDPDLNDTVKFIAANAILETSCFPLLYATAPSLILPAAILTAGHAVGTAISRSDTLKNLVVNNLRDRFNVEYFKAEDIGNKAKDMTAVALLALSGLPLLSQLGQNIGM